MDVGIITSYIIAGMIFLAITMMTLSLSQSSTELTLNQNARQNVQSVSEMLNYDITKIGYNRIESIQTGAITFADSNKVTFLSNIDNSADGSVETITWEFTTDPVATSENPDDYKLLRIQDGDVTEITLGVTEFSIRYFDSYGLPKAQAMAMPVAAANLDNIRQIEIELMCQSPVPIANRSGTDRYLKSAWKKRFSPGNLE